MLKDFFQSNIHILNELRSEQFKVSEYLAKGKYKLKPKIFSKGKRHYDFDINSQEYLHEVIDDVVFYSSYIQELFIDYYTRLLHKPVQFKHREKYQCRSLSGRKTPGQVRVMLAKFFRNRAKDLEYEKYKILLRLHNLGVEEEVPFVKSRVNLIDKYIQICLHRETRLKCEDHFEESYTASDKPVPINESGQSIYKYLDYEECWSSNIAREDIIVYSRRKLYRSDILMKDFEPTFSAFKHIVSVNGLDLFFSVEEELAKASKAKQKYAYEKAKVFVDLIEKYLEIISPGNLIEKENISTFFFFIFGVEREVPLVLPLYSAIYLELFYTYNSILRVFFKGLIVSYQKKLIALIPKLNSFCSIIFKYQHKEILYGKQYIRLGLEDDIDLRKYLYTMLEESWVKYHVTVDFERFETRLKLQPINWPLDTIVAEEMRQQERRKKYKYTLVLDSSTEELIRLIRLTDYHIFRKNLKARSEKILSRANEKFFHMYMSANFNNYSPQIQYLDKLSSLLKTYLNSSTKGRSLLKENALGMLKIIFKNNVISNPVDIEIQYTLKCLHIREIRAKIMGILNGMKSYHRNLALDLRVICGQSFSSVMDDRFLINSNKQTLYNFYKAIKDTQTYFSRVSHESNLKLNYYYFVQHSTYERSQMYKKDIVSIKYSWQYIPHVYVCNGRKIKQKIIYYTVEKDLFALEERILKTCSVFIQKYESYVHLNSLGYLVDRVALLTKAYYLYLSYTFYKFKLIYLYYYMYENTINPLDAFKISKIIVELMHKEPKLDNDENNFVYAYGYNIEQLKYYNRIVQVLIDRLEKVESEKNRIFHSKYARALNIPMTLQAYIYGDIYKKHRHGAKIQRMHTSNSKVSKESNKSHKKTNEIRAQIKEEFEEESEESSDSFDLENYDEYLLTKDMDAIFDDMAITDEFGNVKYAVQINAIAIYNLVVNPKFEGGPHIKIPRSSLTYITASKQQRLLDFSESIAVIANVHAIFEELSEQFVQDYGYCSQIYQLAASKKIAIRMHTLCLQPIPLPSIWLPFETDDPYEYTITKSMKYYYYTMASCLYPPSSLHLAVPSTLYRHQEKLPAFNVLQYLDYHSLQSLLTLKRPINTFSYRYHCLGINFLEYIELQERVWAMQLERDRLCYIYMNIGKHVEVIVDKVGMAYGNSGQGEIFMASHELKLYNSYMGKYPVLNESIEEFRTYLNCELADLEMFKTVVKISKLQLEELVIMITEVGKTFFNGRLKKERITALHDTRNLKMIRNRLGGLLSIHSSEVLRNHSFFKAKSLARNKVYGHLRDIAEINYDSFVNVTKERLSLSSIDILCSKYRRKLQLKCLYAYTQDILLTTNKNLVLIEMCSMLGKLYNIIISLPFLSKLFTIPNYFPYMYSKVFFDQVKLKQPVPIRNDMMDHDQIKDVYYVYPQRQLLEEWTANDSFAATRYLEQFNPREKYEFGPPKTKYLIFKWAFGVTDECIDYHAKKAIQHFISSLIPFTGRYIFSYYRSYYIDLPFPSVNKYFQLHQHYQALLEYLYANILIISLSCENDILASIKRFALKKINFELNYPLNDVNAIKESIEASGKKGLAIFYDYQSNYDDIKSYVQEKIENKKYPYKKQAWAVHGEIVDFVRNKVEGYGLIREAFLPLYIELSNFGQIESGESLRDTLMLKTKNVYKYSYLAIWYCYLNYMNEKYYSEFYAYFFKLLNWLTEVPEIEFYNLIEDGNARVAISQFVYKDEYYKYRFHLKVYDKCSASLVNRMKYVVSVCNGNLEYFVRKLANNSSAEITFNSHYKHNHKFLSRGWKLCEEIGEINRMKLFARVRYYYEKAAGYMKTTPMTLTYKYKEYLKAHYNDTIIVQNLITVAAIAFSSRVQFPVSARTFKDSFMELNESNEINTFTIYDKLYAYKNEAKIQFSKSETALIGKNEGGNYYQYNKTIRDVISTKLMTEELKNIILKYSIRILKAERLPKSYPKRLVHSSLIPRVHLISSYSSPLIIDRKSYISQQYKLAFLQAFINRFRNKVSRVDLLSSGYGFVITVPDLEDCVNFMNKLLFTFAEKYFRTRSETFSQYYEILIEAINEKNKVINYKYSIIKYLQNKTNNILEAEYLHKVTKLLYEKTLVEEKLRTVENNLHGLEDRVRKTVEIYYAKKVASLEKENYVLRNQFHEFKELIVVLAKDATKNNFLTMLNGFKDRVNDLLNKKVDFNVSFEDLRYGSANKGRAKEDYSPKKYKSPLKYQSYTKGTKQGKDYTILDIQQCKIGEDIIHDPYYTTKLINKMRVFNLFKMGAKRLRFDYEQSKKTGQLSELQKIQDVVIAQSEKEALIRYYFAKAQYELSRKCVELDKIRQTLETYENERTKLKVLLQLKDKKIYIKERYIAELKNTEKSSTTINAYKDKADDLPKLAQPRIDKRNHRQRHEKTMFMTNVYQDSNISIYDRFYLSSKDSTWRYKCYQLYIENKKLVSELEKYSNAHSTVSTPARDGFSLDFRKKQGQGQSYAISTRDAARKFPNLTFKYNIMKQTHGSFYG